MPEDKNKNFDEEEIRKKVRSDLLARHQERQSEQDDRIASESELPENKDLLKKQIKKIIRLRLEEKIFRKYPQFIKCSNHLGEILWLTEKEINNQHEFYPHEESFRQRLKVKRKPKLPKLPWIDQYTRDIEQEIAADIEERLESVKNEITSRDSQDSDQKIKDIIAQEEESFFQAHPSYKLYRSYTGQTKWLTKDEFENQDEFVEEVKSPWRTAMNYLALIGPIVLLLVISYLFLVNNKDQNAGYVVIDTGEHTGQIYIDERLILGYSPERPIKLSNGTHRIDFKKSGFSSNPLYYEITLDKMDTTHLHFSMIPIDTTNQVVLVFGANAVDAKVFINNDFSGTLDNNLRYLISPGKHRITLKKDNFHTEPPFRDIVATRQDTLHLRYSFIPQKQQPVKAVENEGLIEVIANIHGARIFINDRDTGQETNYIFYKLPYGRHRITLVKPGYTIQPSYQDFVISKDNLHVKAIFEIKQDMFRVKLSVEPEHGKIFIDNEEVGTGFWQGELSRGEHLVDFSDINYYQKPQSKKIFISEDTPKEYYFSYNFKFHVSFTPEEIRPSDYKGSIQVGYISDERDFHSDPNNGPQTIKSDLLNRMVWQLGYAFKYRNPPECDAIRFSFNVPGEVNLKENLFLKIWGYKTKEKYPLSISNNSRIQIIINNKIVKNEYEPAYLISEASENIFEQIVVNSHLQHGRNYIRLATNENNSVYYLLWKIAVE
jgi:hypothetical protein